MLSATASASESTDPTVLLAVAVIGVIGVAFGGIITSASQHWSVRQTQIEQVRTRAAEAGALTMEYVGSLRHVINAAQRGQTQTDLNEALDQLNDTYRQCRRAVSLLYGAPDVHISEQAGQLHNLVVQMSNEVMPLVSGGRFKEAQSLLDTRDVPIQAANNILLTMVEPLERMTNRWGTPMFRNKHQATTVLIERGTERQRAGQ